MELHDRCPHCMDGILIFIHGVEPWSTAHLQCDLCDSTYEIDTIPDEGECYCVYCSGLKEGRWAEMMVDKIVRAIKTMSPEDYTELLAKVRELNEIREEKQEKKNGQC